MRIQEIKNYPSNLQVIYTKDGENHVEDISFDGMCAMHTKDEWREDLRDRGFDEASIKSILGSLDWESQGDLRFFLDDNSRETIIEHFGEDYARENGLLDYFSGTGVYALRNDKQ